LRFGANNGAFPVVWTDPDQRLRVKLLGEESAVNPGYLKGPADPVLWQVVDSAPSYRIQGRVESLSFRPDGKELATNNKIWSVANNQGRLRLRPSSTKVPGEFAVFLSCGQLWSWNRFYRRNTPLEILEVAPEIRRMTLGARDFDGGELVFSRD